MVQLRSDSRKFIDDTSGLRVGDMELESGATQQGYNGCLSEFQASVLLEQMEQLDKYNEIKIDNAKKIKEIINEIPGFSTIRISNKISYQTFYGMIIKMDKEYFGNMMDVNEIVNELRNQLKLGSFFIHTMYKPVHKNEIFCPWNSSRYNNEFVGNEDYWRKLSYPVAENAHTNTIILHHSMLLAQENKIKEIGDVLHHISKMVQ